MKYYSTSAAVVTTVRKDGHYPSSRTAAFLAKRIAFVLDREQVQDHIASCLCGSSAGMAWCRTSLPPSEFLILWNLMDWWAKDSSGEVRASDDARAFFCVDLNTGRSLMILDRS